jgi:hypothetical protein
MTRSSQQIHLATMHVLVQGTEVVDQKGPAPYSSDQTNILTKEALQGCKRLATDRIYKDAN